MAEQKARLDPVAAMPDEQIDDSDAPTLPDAVLEFFKRTGARYQSRMNAVLRAYVEAHKGQTER